MTQRIPPPRAVLFDLFDTLVPAMASTDDFPPTWEDLGVSVDAYQKRWMQNHDGRATGRIRDPVEVLRVVVHDLVAGFPMERLRWATDRRIRRFEHVLTSADARIVGAVARLKASGVKVALVSNACVGEIEAWPRSPLAAHFDAAVFSCDVGVAKPDPGIYEEALRRVDTAPADALFVGDGGSSELRGAREAGLGTVLVSGWAMRHWSHAMAARREFADWEFDGVPEFVEAALA